MSSYAEIEEPDRSRIDGLRLRSDATRRRRVIAAPLCAGAVAGVALPVFGVRVFGEILGKHTCEFACGFVVGVGIGPGIARVKDSRIDPGEA